MRVALDTNVLVAAFATRGLCADLFQALVAQHRIVVPDLVLAELERALRAKLRFPPAHVNQILAYLRDVAEIAPPGAHLSIAALDAADAAILASALHAGAEALITGDRAVLALGRLESMAIVAPRELWARMVAERP